MNPQIDCFNERVGPNLTRQFLLGDQFTRAYSERCQHIEGARTDTDWFIAAQQQASSVVAEQAKIAEFEVVAVLPILARAAAVHFDSLVIGLGAHSRRIGNRGSNQ